MHSAIQLAGFHYIVCLKALPTNADFELTFGKSTYQFLSIASADNTRLHVEFQNWAAVSVLRDLIEQFSIFLTEVYHDAVVGGPNGAYTVTPDKFERMGIEDQLTTLATDFAVDAAWITRLTGYNRVRNCLAHRAGIVGLKDTNDGNELVVRWLTKTVTSNDGPVSAVIEAEGPMSHLISGRHIEGKAATMEVLDRERRFKIGDSVRLMPDELLEICQTVHVAAAVLDTLAFSA